MLNLFHIEHAPRYCPETTVWVFATYVEAFQALVGFEMDFESKVIHVIVPRNAHIKVRQILAFNFGYYIYDGYCSWLIVKVW